MKSIFLAFLSFMNLSSAALSDTTGTFYDCSFTSDGNLAKVFRIETSINQSQTIETPDKRYTLYVNWQSVWGNLDFAILDTNGFESWYVGKATPPSVNFGISNSQSFAQVECTLQRGKNIDIRAL